MARPSPGRIVGSSAAIKKLHVFLERVAATNATILVNGESGTGKELAARMLHASSPRAARPFVAINCAAVPENLLESEFFGHEKGAFTGAVARHEGVFERAHTGTLFLDEIAEMAPSTQARMLRVLESHSFTRVGGTEEVSVDVRLVAATHRNLRELVAEGLFREDLLYRLSVIQTRLPPLRERRDDIPELVRHFCGVLGDQMGRHVGHIADDALEVLTHYRWPGNVRELRNVVERALVLGDGPVLELDDLPPELQLASPPAASASGEFAGLTPQKNPPARRARGSRDRRGPRGDGQQQGPSRCVAGDRPDDPVPKTQGSKTLRTAGGRADNWACRHAAPPHRRPHSGSISVLASGCWDPPELDPYEPPLPDLGAVDTWSAIEDAGQPPDDGAAPEVGDGEPDTSADPVESDPGLAQLRLTEALVDPDGKDGGVGGAEYVEILNNGPSPVILDGLVVNAASWPALDSTALGLDGLELATGQILVVSRWATDVDPSLAQLRNRASGRLDRVSPLERTSQHGRVDPHRRRCDVDRPTRLWTDAGRCKSRIGSVDVPVDRGSLRSRGLGQLRAKPW